MKKWNHWIRRGHRWLSIAFTLGVIVNFVALAQKEPALWVGIFAAAPLVLLAFSGLYLFVLPYLPQRRSAPAGSPTSTLNLDRPHR